MLLTGQTISNLDNKSKRDEYFPNIMEKMHTLKRERLNSTGKKNTYEHHLAFLQLKLRGPVEGCSVFPDGDHSAVRAVADPYNWLPMAHGHSEGRKNKCHLLATRNGLFLLLVFQLHVSAEIILEGVRRLQ